ncbi:hypothetical protein ACQ86G_19280 [Roseateles chitinivorans]|uniref:hypothetical protein n=1 Tax=Roseateles chitinivorans TaxID=2917965 RepID=UPI003D67F86C
MNRSLIRLGRLLTAFLSTLAVMPAALSAADPATGTSAADVRWACEQPLIARVRLTSIGLQAPDAPCAQGAGDTQAQACRVVVAQAVVLDTLPSLGGRQGLSLTEPEVYGRTARRFSFRLATRDPAPPVTPPVGLVGATGLVTLPTAPAWGAADPAKWSLGTFLADSPATGGDLDALCKPFRHWSGLRSAAMPEQLPGDFPARSEGPNALSKRIAALIGPTPPDIAAIEQSFGARMVATGASRPDFAQTRTLARLSGQWLRITHDLYTDRPGPPAVILNIAFSGPQETSRRAPWWERDPTDGPMRGCVTSSMIVDQVGDGWRFSRISLPYRGRFLRHFPQYDVHFEFSPPYIASTPGDGFAPQSGCLEAVHVYYLPSSGS